MHSGDFENPSDSEIRSLLKRVSTIAVVGLSTNPERPSHEVASTLQQFGYRIVPVNPAHDQILGEKSYSGLVELVEPVQLVDVFRACEHVPDIVSECIRLGLPALWLQEGVVHVRAAQQARNAGITVVMDRCIYQEYKRLL